MPASSFIFPVMAYLCSIFSARKVVCASETEEIFLEGGILLCVAVPFLLILRLLCHSTHLPELLKEQESCVWVSVWYRWIRVRGANSQLEALPAHVSGIMVF